jgi:AraC-like DNA-binding protein
MSQFKPEPQVSARVGALIVRAATALGADLPQLLAATGFDPTVLDDPDARISLVQEEALWQQAVRQTGDPAFGLHAAELLRPGAFDVLDYAVRTAPDLREALQRLVRYHRLVHDLAVFTVNEAPGQAACIEHRFAVPGIQPCRHALEFKFASVLVIGAQVTGAPMQALQVSFPHAAPPALDEYRRIFGVEPVFMAPAATLTLGRDLLARPLAADAGLSRIVLEHADRLLQARQQEADGADGLVARVSRCLAEHLCNGPPSLSALARQLHMSERSLQRRLEAEGTRFAALVDAVRKDLALRYLADPRLALGEVAYLLGFAEPSPFHRAFKRWTGTTPAAMRRGAHGV